MLSAQEGNAVAGPVMPTAVEVDPSTRTGQAPDTAAASCWEIKQLHSGAVDGAYWLLTPRMTEPQQFWCDMTTDGGGWVRVGAGRDRWSSMYDGKGNPAQLATEQPSLTVGIQLPSTTVDALLDGGRVDELSEGVRVRRAADAAGLTWQEVRFGIVNRDRWVWSFGAEHRVSSWRVGSLSGSGGGTRSFGSGSGTFRVSTDIQSAQGFRWGFAYGSQVTGTNSSSTYLWSSSDGQGGALPYAEVFLRPRLTSRDLEFPRIADSGAPAGEQVAAADSVALANPWGVSGTAGGTSTEGNVEVQTFEQIGNVMYVGGNFRYVQRDAAGASRVEQSFLAAFNASTGEWVSGFSPTFNEQVRTLAALPNGNLAVGGDFTTLNGQSVPGLVAVDPATGARVNGWGPQLENGIAPGVVRVRGMEVRGSWLYLGGNFTHLSNPDGSGRTYARNAGRVAAATGEPDRWNPEFNGTVLDVATSEDGARTYFSGHFGTAGGQTAFRAAAVMADSGNLDPVPWDPAWSSVNKDYQRAIEQAGNRVWVGGSEHSLFDFSTSTYERLGGSITKRGGDFQAIDARGGQVFAGCHCNDWVYQDAYTWSNVGTAWSQADTIGWFGQWDNTNGRYVPYFTPQFSLRLGSGIWAIKIAEDGTVWAGGDVVSGRTTAGAQWLGGFGRWPARDTTAPTTPGNVRITSQDASSVTLSWGASTGASGYQVMRDDRTVAMTNGGRTVTVPKGGENRFFVRAVDVAGNVSASSPVLATGDGNPAPVPVISYDVNGLRVTLDGSGSTDDGTIEEYLWDLGDGTTGEGPVLDHEYATTGTYQVRLTVVDDQGAFRRTSESVDLSMPAPSDAYGAAVIEDNPFLYWRLNEASGDVAQDHGGNDRAGNYYGGATRGASGALAGTEDAAAGFDGSSGHVVGRANTQVTNPGPFSTEVWFRTTTTAGGKLIGFGNQPTGLSNNYDRHVFMLNDGRLAFGVWTGAENRATSTAAYNDGQWHHMVATQGADGMRLYVDGELVGSNPQTAAENFTGYWRIGGDRVWSGASSGYLAATLDEAAVYTSALPADRVAAHYEAGINEPAPNQQPQASFTMDVDGLTVSVDGSGSSDPDGELVSYEWDFGDGSTATGETAGHAYAEAGTYDVALTVTDDRGAEVTTSQQATVEVPPNQDPVADFTAQVSGLSVTVDASGSSDADGQVSSYAWDFGDGNTATGVTAHHDYVAGGAYEVTLTVIDDEGATASRSRQVTVAELEEGTTTVVARDASWSWYFDTPEPPVDWNDIGGDVSAWSSGPAPLGFNFDGVATDIDVDGPTTDRWRVAYFRREFEVPHLDRVVSLVLDTVANDGVVVHVNGVEVGRHNMPDGEIEHTTFSATARNVTEANADPVVIEVPRELLVEGTNVVAAQTHLKYRGTRDVSFELDAELTTGPPGSNPPPEDDGQETVVVRDASWSWHFDTPEPPADWNQVGGDVSAWEVGPAPLGFNFDGVATDIDVDGPTEDRWRVAYFRREFQVPDAEEAVALTLNTVANDGVLVHVNGVEVGRHNMPDGEIEHTTFSATARNVTEANADPVVIEVPPDLLVDGVNVVAAQTHLKYRGTRDVSFELDAQLSVEAG